MAACTVEPGADRAQHCLVGNITGKLVTPDGTEGLSGRDGTLGTTVEPPPLRSTAHQWGPGSLLVLATDGLRSGWDPGQYEGLVGHHPVVVAAVLHRDHVRPNDDATVVVVEDHRCLELG